MEAVVNSKIKWSYILVNVFLLSIPALLALGLCLDTTIHINNDIKVIIIILGLLPLALFLIALTKIPKIRIEGDSIFYQQGNHSLLIENKNSTSLEELKKTNFWYSNRGGLKAKHEDQEFVIPYHVFSNEPQILNAIAPSDYQLQPFKIDYDLSYSKYLLRLWRNPVTIYLLLSLCLIILIFSKSNMPQFALFLILGIAGLGFVAFKLTSKYIYIDQNNILEIDPILLRSRAIPIESVKSINSKAIRSNRLSIKNLTLRLKNNQLVTLNAGLNKQSELMKIEEAINAQKNEQEKIADRLIVLKSGQN